MAKGMGGHQSAASRTNTWITPLEIIRPLGEFDLDPCAAVGQPWPTAKNHYTEADNGLIKDWFGRVWLNPPYTSSLIVQFMRKMAEDGNGIALTFARTDTNFFHQYVFHHASSVFFIKQRIFFCNIVGIRAKGSGGAPSVLISYGEQNADAIDQAGFKGHHVSLTTNIVVVGVSPTWFSVVSIAVRNHGDDQLKPIYDMVERIAPDKVSNNQWWKEKVRQQLQIIRKKKTA